MKKYWFVWNEGNREPRFPHDNLTGAKQEAERLARMNKGQTFYILETVDACKSQDIFWASENPMEPF